MANKIQLKRSAVAAKVPTTTDLDLGEIGVNTYDGKVYIKKDSGTPSIVEVTGPGVTPGTTGNVLTSNGTIWTSAAPSAPSPVLRVNGPYINESDLTEGPTANSAGDGVEGNVGDWQYMSGSGSAGVSFIAGETNHPGILRLNGTSTGGAYRMLHSIRLGHQVADINTFIAVVRLTGSSNNNVRVGWTNTSTSGSPTMAAYFTSTGGWKCETRLSGTATSNSGPAITYGNWYELKIIRNGSGNYEFYINGTLQFTNTTNLPTGALECGVYCYDSTNTNHVDIDYIGVIGKTYTQRYT